MIPFEPGASKLCTNERFRNCQKNPSFSNLSMLLFCLKGSISFFLAVTIVSSISGVFIVMLSVYLMPFLHSHFPDFPLQHDMRSHNLNNCRLQIKPSLHLPIPRHSVPSYPVRL